MARMKNGKLSLNLLNPAELKEGIKGGHGVKHFCEKYSCTEDALRQRVSAVFRNSPKIVRSIMADLRANDKKLDKKAAIQSARGAEVDDETEATNITTDTDKVDDMPPRPMTRSEQLEALRLIEKERSDKVIELETSHKKLVQEHRERIKKLRSLKKDIDEIEITLKAKCREYEDIVLENNTLVMQMNVISRERYAEAAELDKTRLQIEDLEKIEICVYLDGTIAPIEDQPLRLDDTGSDELYATLIEDERCQNLRLKSIRTLARLIKIVEHSSRKIEILFDYVELESAFYIFCS